MGKVQLEGQPAHVSWSALETWLSCPTRYYLRRIAKVEERPMFAGIGGSALHKATEDIDFALIDNDRSAE